MPSRLNTSLLSNRFASLKNTMRSRRAKLAGIAAAAAGLMSAGFASISQASIAIQDAAVGTGQINGSGPDNSDVAFSGTMGNFSVTSGASVLVVDFGSCVSVAGDATPTLKWNGTPLIQAATVTSSVTSWTVSGVYYLYNPTPGTGLLTYSGSSRSSALVPRHVSIDG